MNDSSTSAIRSLARQMKESDWWALVKAVRDGKLVPLVGTDLMRVEVDGRSVAYDHLIATELAKSYGIVNDELQSLASSLDDASLNDVVLACVRQRHDDCRYELHYAVSDIIRKTPIQPSQTLKQLAQITDIDLFVTASYDPLFESALRSVGNLNTRVYRRNDGEKEDLPKDARARRGQNRWLYYLFGKAERGTQDFAICDEDLLRFNLRLYDSKYRPKRLFDALRESHLLLLGVNFGDWLARFFLWLAKDRENLTAEEARNLREYLADRKAGQDRPLVLFLQHFSKSTIILGNQPEEFVQELYQRWSEPPEGSDAHPDTVEPKPPSTMPTGAVFLSYSRNDAPAVKTMFAELTRAGISAWYDAALGAGDDYDPKLEYNIKNCSLFLPLVSAGTLQRVRAYFRKEWGIAVDRDKQYFGTEKSGIVPIIIDEDDSIFKRPESYTGMPERFRQVQMYHCPKGSPSPDLIASLLTHSQTGSGARSGNNR